MKKGLPGEASPSFVEQDFAAYFSGDGSGDNLLRSGRIAQPRTLRDGDILATGYAVVGKPRVGFNSSILICLTLGMYDVRWVSLPPRIPIALEAEEDGTVYKRNYALPAELECGDIIGNGDEVLSKPQWCCDEGVMLRLTGGAEGHTIWVPDIVPIAILTEVDNAPVEIWDRARKWKKETGYRD